ncbi:hypothetical protein KSP40_PGU020295 [Platanthera guangdongensis]|uniref:Uncharacterized protein n=1 Tax=Platanthera guangdongensis TaxID=2320717 RepID=A0ABR2LPR5_9ASPA
MAGGDEPEALRLGKKARTLSQRPAGPSRRHIVWETSAPPFCDGRLEQERIGHFPAGRASTSRRCDRPFGTPAAHISRSSPECHRADFSLLRLGTAGMAFRRVPKHSLSEDGVFCLPRMAGRSADTYCWSKIDIKEWCRRVNLVNDIIVGVTKLVTLSRGMVHRISAYHIGSYGFSFTAIS